SIVSQPRNPGGLESCLGGGASLPPPLEGIRAVGCGGAGGDRRRSALCRYGPFWPQADQSSLALSGLPCPAAELLRPGSPPAVRPHRRRQSVLSALSDMGPG